MLVRLSTEQNAELIRLQLLRKAEMAGITWEQLREVIKDVWKENP